MRQVLSDIIKAITVKEKSKPKEGEEQETQDLAAFEAGYIMPLFVSIWLPMRPILKHLQDFHPRLYNY